MAKGNPFKEREQRLAANAAKLSSLQPAVKPAEGIPIVPAETKKQESGPAVELPGNKRFIAEPSNKTTEYKQSNQTKKVGRPTTASEKTIPATVRLTERQIEAIQMNVGRGRPYRDKSELVREAIDKLLNL